MGRAVVVGIEAIRGLGIWRILLLTTYRYCDEGANHKALGYWQVPFVHVWSPQHVSLFVHAAPLPPQLVPCWQVPWLQRLPAQHMPPEAHE